MSLIRIGLEDFEQLVQVAIDDVPEPFASLLAETAVVVEEHSPPGQPALYGLYQGHPITVGQIPSGAMPPKITVFMHPLVDHCRTLDELEHQVRVTVLHELGHHLGMDEDHLHRLGYG
ncbi:MAG: metallopeptidase family protein [Thermoleophilia bacterium]|nr:metallopeptidase family protein [Thermoleophilia bacterium]